MPGAPAGNAILVLDAAEFPPEGDDCDARLLCRAFELGWKQFMVTATGGSASWAAVSGSDTEEVRDRRLRQLRRLSGLRHRRHGDHVHGNAQDQLGQIMKRGKLVVHGDVGQTFMYGAKGGEVYIMGNAAGRPLINAVGRPRVVINGTALDFLAESFMAGDPHQGGGFVIVNGLEYDPRGGSAPGHPLSRLQPLFPGLRRRPLYPRPLRADGGRAVQRRRDRRPRPKRTGT